MANEVHYHSCPTCYKNYSCAMDCTIEPDLSKDGLSFGSYCQCDECEQGAKVKLGKFDLVSWYKAESQKKYPTSKWWNLYNGLK